MLYFSILDYPVCVKQRGQHTVVFTSGKCVVTVDRPSIVTKECKVLELSLETYLSVLSEGQLHSLALWARNRFWVWSFDLYMQVPLAEHEGKLLLAPGMDQSYRKVACFELDPELLEVALRLG